MGWGAVPGWLLDPWLPLAAWVALFRLAVRRTAPVALAGAAVTSAVLVAVVLVTAPHPLPAAAALDEAAGTALTGLVVVQLGQLRRLVVARRRRLAARVDGLARERAAAAAAERERLARDLHDAAGHHLSAVVVQSTAALRLRGTRPELSAPALAGAARSGRAVLATVRSLATPQTIAPANITLEDALQPLCDGLRRLGGPVALRVHGERPHRLGWPGARRVRGGRATLPDAVVAAALRARTPRLGWPGACRVRGGWAPLPDDVVAAAFRIVQEALTNAMRYAPGAAVTVDVAYRPRELAITVVNARPPSAETPALGGGRGLAGMRRRAAELGGELTAGPDAAGGWSVRAVLPLPHAVKPWRRTAAAAAGLLAVAAAAGWPAALATGAVVALAGVYAAGAHARTDRSWLAPVGAGALAGAVVGLAEPAGPATVALAALWGAALAVWLLPVWALGVLVRVRRGRYGRRQQELLAERRRVAAGVDSAVGDHALRLVRVAESHAATPASGDAAASALATVEADAREALAGLRRLLDALDDPRARVPA